MVQLLTRGHLLAETIFSMVNKNSATEEMKEHNVAIEKLSKEQMEHNTKRAKNQDWLNTQIARK